MLSAKIVSKKLEKFCSPSFKLLPPVLVRSNTSSRFYRYAATAVMCAVIFVHTIIQDLNKCSCSID